MSLDDQLRRAYRSHGRVEAAERHPDADHLWRLAAGEMAAAQARAVIDHLSRCPACAEDFRLTRGLVAAAEEGAEPGRSRELAPPARRGLRALVALAATLAIAVLAWHQWLPTPPTPPSFRQGEAPELLTHPATGSVLARDAVLLSWSGAEGTAYDVTVMTEDLRILVDRKRLEVSELVVPESVLRDLPDGSVLHWRVEAKRADGTALASRSSSFQLEISPPTQSSPSGE